jgi:hypothetical protein
MRTRTRASPSWPEAHIASRTGRIHWRRLNRSYHNHACRPGAGHTFEQALTLLRPGGLIAVDNTLWGGSVVDAGKTDTDTLAIRAFNTALHADPRIELSLVPIGDGLTLARKVETVWV